MNYKTIFAAAAMAGTAAIAQPQSSPPPPTSVATPAVDEARRAAARAFIESAIPEGWIEQIARAVSGQGGFTGPPPDPREARRDRHFDERRRLTQMAVQNEVIRALRAEEPALRALMIEFYARRFTVQELEAAARFYSSPAGQRLMSGTLSLLEDGEYVEAIVRETEAINAEVSERVARRFADESAHLPPLEGAEAPPERAPPSRVASRGRARPVVPRRPATPADPARLAAAQRAVQVMLHREQLNFPTNIDPILDALLAMRIGSFGIPIPPESEVSADETVGQAIARFDPAFRERARIAIRIWAEEMNRSNAETAPIEARILAEAYARQFTVEELDAFTAFHGSPEGVRLIAGVNSMLEDPQVIAYFAEMFPRMLSEMGPAFERIQAATAHLPPPPAPRRRRRSD